MKLDRIAATGCSSLLLAGCLTGCQTVQQTISTAEQSDVETAVTTVPVQTTTIETTTTEPLQPFDYTICFSGDICIEDNAYTTQYWKSCGEDITQCIDETMIEHMRSADICFINNEFPYSTRGSATVGKDYTYRADPANV
ncbi:MAG: CapA family protein, partial [Oscillospiraceae bacterium]|nr:CapA family protein [Oscillospiraceae bacterium]